MILPRKISFVFLAVTICLSSLKGEVKKHFKNLLSYSPYHNIKRQRYPAIMVMTGDGDDRVVPAHSYKYAARLQDVLRSDGDDDDEDDDESLNKMVLADPSVVLLYTQSFASHHGSADYRELAKAQAAKLAFLIKELE